MLLSWYNKGNAEIFLLLSTDTNIFYCRVILDHTFNFTQTNIISSLQLYEILLSINYLNGTIIHQLPYISGFEPTFSILFEEVLFGFLWHFVVLFGYITSSNINFSSWTFRISYLVVAFFPIYQLNINTLRWTSDTSCAQVISIRNTSSRTTFSQSISLQQGDSKHCPTIIMCVGGKWGTSR